MANFSTVLLGLSGPVTQPTSDVPGGEGWAPARAGRLPRHGLRSGWGLLGGSVGGVGAGATAACCWTCAERGRSALTIPDVHRTELRSGARSFAPGGRCPVGRRSDDEGKVGSLGLGRSGRRLCCCGGACARLGGRWWRDAGGNAQADSGRRCHRYRGDSQTRRHDTPFQGHDFALTSAVDRCDASDRWGLSDQ